MTLEVVIVSFNTRQILKNCLKSLFENLSKENLTAKTRVTVVDNNSKDGTVAMLKEDFPGVKIIANKNNLGFAAANNQAITVSTAEYIFLLNSDTIVCPQSISKLLLEIGKSKTTKVVGPKLLNVNGTLQQSFGFTPTFFKVANWMLFFDDLPFLDSFIRPYHASQSRWYQARHEVDWVSGAALLFKRDIIKTAGLLDEKIFMYGEEVEWCYRVRRIGGKIVFSPSSEIIHLGGGSQKGPGTSIIREFQSINYFYRKYFPEHILSVRLLLKIGALLRLILFGIIKADPSKIDLYAKAFKVA